MTRTRRRLAYFPDYHAQNPYQRLLYRDLEDFGIDVVEHAQFTVRWLWRRRRDTEIVHLHWPEGLYRARRRPRALLSGLKFAYLAIRLIAVRVLGYRLVWTIHQVYPHRQGNRLLDRLVPRILAGTSDALLAHDAHTAALVEKHLHVPRDAVHVAPHPSYAGAYGPGRQREAVRAELGLPPEATVFLCFGLLRIYKSIDVLLEAFQLLAARDAVLLFAGAPSSAKTVTRIDAAAAHDPRIKPLLGFVQPEEVADRFAAADVAVFPRGDGGTSGSLVLALSMGVPVIAARMPANEEITHGDAAAWLFRAGDAASLRACLEAAANDPDAVRAKAAAARRIRGTVGWDRQARARTAQVIRGDADVG